MLTDSLLIGIFIGLFIWMTVDFVLLLSPLWESEASDMISCGVWTIFCFIFIISPRWLIRKIKQSRRKKDASGAD